MTNEPKASFPDKVQTVRRKLMTLEGLVQQGAATAEIEYAVDTFMSAAQELHTLVRHKKA